MTNKVFRTAPALCLDMDGTVRRSKSDHEGFIKGPDDIELIPGVEYIIMSYKYIGYVIYGVSNQGGVAFGYKTPEDVIDENDMTRALFEHDPIEKVVVCYCHPDGTVEPYNNESMYRKPNTGMLAIVESEAIKKGVIVDWSDSLIVGDRPEDEQLAANAGVEFIHIDDFLNVKMYIKDDITVV